MRIRKWMSIPTPQTVHQQFIPIKSFAKASVIFFFILYISLEAEGKFLDVGLALSRAKYHGNLKVFFLFNLGLAPTLVRTTRRRWLSCSPRLFRPSHLRRKNAGNEIPRWFFFLFFVFVFYYFLFQLNQHDRISILSLFKSTKNLWISNGISNESCTLWNQQKHSAELLMEKINRSLHNGPKDLIRMRRPNAKNRRDTSGRPCCCYPLPVGNTRSSRWSIVVINFSTSTSLEKKKIKTFRRPISKWEAELLLTENTSSCACSIQMLGRKIKYDTPRDFGAEVASSLSVVSF